MIAAVINNYNNNYTDGNFLPIDRSWERLKISYILVPFTSKFFEA